MAVSVAGRVDVGRGLVLAAVNIKGWERVPVGDILTASLGAPVLVGMDTHLALQAEHWRGAAVGHENCALIYVGTGIGGAIMIDGQLRRGHHFQAGKIDTGFLDRLLTTKTQPEGDVDPQAAEVAAIAAGMFALMGQPAAGAGERTLLESSPTPVNSRSEWKRTARHEALQ